MSSAPRHVTIRVLQLRRPFVAAHLTDSHLMEFDPGEPHADAILHRRETWKGSERWGANSTAALQAARARAELILHTGDWCDFPTAANVRIMREQLAAQPPLWWVSGNHDWNFPGERPDAPTKLANAPLLEPLGFVPFWAREHAGVRFIGVDNSNYQITAEQLAFVRAQFAQGPCVLLVHIPITLPDLRERARERWGCPILMGENLNADQRRGWGVAPDDPATAAFVELCHTSPNLHAVLAGHVHFPHQETLRNGAVQNVGAPAYDCQWTLVNFQPA